MIKVKLIKIFINIVKEYLDKKKSIQKIKLR